MSPASKAQQKAVNKYMKENYDRINLTVPKGKKEIVSTHAPVSYTHLDVYKRQPQTLEEIRKITETFRGIPLLTNQVIGGKTPRLTAREAHEIGYKIIIYPDVMPFCASVMFRRACDRIMAVSYTHLDVYKRQLIACMY